MASVRVRLLARATEMVGGVELMAAALEVTADQLRQWLQGENPVPPEVYFRALELVNENRQGASPMREGRSHSPIRKRPH